MAPELEGIEFKRLDDVCLSISDGDWIESKDQSPDGYRLLQIGNIGIGQFRESGKPKYVSEETFNRLRCTKIEIGDVLIARMPDPTGRSWCVDDEIPASITSVDVAIVRVEPSKLDAKYLAYFLNSPATLVRNAEMQTGSTRQRIKRSDLADMLVPLPPLATQIGIANVLSGLDSKIKANSNTSKTLEEIAQAIFKSWFVNFDPVKAKATGEKPVGMDTATAALFPDSMEDSELGQIPKGWAVKPFFDFQLEIESGTRPKGGVKGITHGVPSIGAESINGLGVFEFSKTKYVSEEFFEKMKKGKPKDFDVLLYKDGGKPGEFKPRVGMFGRGFPFKQYAINEHVFLLRSNELGPAFSYFWIRMERTLDVLRNRGIKAAIPGINQQDVGTLPVLWSNSELMSKFSELCMPYLELILTLASESLELSRLRDLLLPRLISGELQIPEEMLVS